MLDKTIKAYEAFIRNHHDDRTFDCIEKCYSMWDFLYRNKDDVKFLAFMKEKGLTDFNIYAGMAIGMLKPWLKKEDLFYDRNVYYQVLPRLNLNTVNDFGEVIITTRINVNTAALPDTVEEYLSLKKLSVETTYVKNDEFVNPFKDETTNEDDN